MTKREQIVRWLIIAAVVMVGGVVAWALIKKQGLKKSTAAAAATGVSGYGATGTNANGQLVEYIPTTGDQFTTNNITDSVLGTPNSGPINATIGGDVTNTLLPGHTNPPPAPAPHPTPNPTPPPILPHPGHTPLPPALPPSHARTYSVRSGDTLANIARQFGTTVQHLAGLNVGTINSYAAQHGISAQQRSRYGAYPATWDYIYAGEQLQVPG